MCKILQTQQNSVEYYDGLIINDPVQIYHMNEFRPITFRGLTQDIADLLCVSINGNNESENSSLQSDKEKEEDDGDSNDKGKNNDTNGGLGNIEDGQENKDDENEDDDQDTEDKIDNENQNTQAKIDYQLLISNEFTTGYVCNDYSQILDKDPKLLCNSIFVSELAENSESTLKSARFETSSCPYNEYFSSSFSFRCDNQEEDQYKSIDDVKLQIQTNIIMIKNLKYLLFIKKLDKQQMFFKING
ncbi:hypothetical protein PPERSA_04627 [Pseudocohnilembus persalinus]|uniref:Uncharacterized protein n=1 Tax=Pseudocohnilembus persalinus TaxID=266149 RepID=A0A0V0QP61_PSEPJ|nr:hypothetical protein PPERSA_04627 [Pseudocohnilembus persalinus]|eukprot:KRX03832.1 hypothetical protein PPERSA_04627 [Pseudocohnilembus persalinus]